jgi:outer membrane protein assembly factor BamB
MYKRHWGAYGNPPVDGPLPPYDPAVVNTFFRNPVHHIRISKDGLVYVADRTNNRIQVFQKNGKFVKEFFTDRNTLGSGSACELEFSKDRKQEFIYVADNCNNQVWIFLRETGEKLVTFGRGGRSAGYFKQAHGVAVDSKGNLYIAEVDTGMRVQRFKFLGYLPLDEAEEYYLHEYYEGERRRGHRD